jgi:hypothetical protein
MIASMPDLLRVTTLCDALGLWEAMLPLPSDCLFCPLAASPLTRSTCWPYQKKKDQLADSFSLTRSTCWRWRITHGTGPASTVLKKVRCTVFTMHRLQFLVSVCVLTVQPTWHTAAARFDRWVRCLQALVSCALFVTRIKSISTLARKGVI